MSPKPNPLYAEKGDLITCADNGHLICTINQDIFRWTAFGTYLFDFVPGMSHVRQGNPHAECKCYKCGGEWYETNPHASYLHFKYGWYYGNDICEKCYHRGRKSCQPEHKMELRLLNKCGNLTTK